MKLKQNKLIIISIAVSILVHALFLAYCMGVRIKGFSAATLIGHADKIFDVKIVQEKKPVKRYAISGAARYGKELRFDQPFSYGITGAQETKPSENIAKKIEDVMDLPTKAKKSVEIEVPGKKLSEYSKTAESVPERKRQVRESVVEEGTIITTDASPLPAIQTSEYASEEFTKEMPGFTPVAVPTVAGGTGTNPLQLKGLLYGSSRGMGLLPGLDEYLTADVATYQDPTDGQKYFKITIIAGKDAEKLKVMPKDVIFLIDCSLSIQQERMEEFKKGLRYCLKNLGKDDTFELVKFKENVQRLSYNPVSPEPQILNLANKFINSLEAGNNTDVYRAFADIIRTPPKRRPSYIMLLSDGRPTTGLTDSREIIVNINKSNKGVRPIFCYSGGVRVNRYLLDFISYRNRGWSEYADRTATISKGLPELYNKIKDPILLNLRYRFSNLKTSQIFPKALPDFYKGTAFTIYGKYENEDDFSMQLLGDSKDETMDFIFSDKLSHARQGDREIARQWAFNKVYYLIGRLADRKHDGRLIRSIRELCRKFNIKTPYSEGIK